MKKAFRFFLGISFSFVLFFVAVVLFSVGGLGVIFDDEPKPEITHKDFHYTITYEILGEKKRNQGTFECEFVGFLKGGGSKSREWSMIYENDMKEIVLQSLDEKYKLCLVIFNPGYFMGDPSEKEFEDDPYFISVVEIDTGYPLYKTEEEQELLEKYRVKIASWECDPPIKNTFK